MKKVILILSLLLFLCCSEEVSKGIPEAITGVWLITEMEYNGQIVYPETKYEGFHSTFVIDDYEDYEDLEDINFGIRDSVVSLPGFQSERLKADFIKLEDEIEFKIQKEANDISKEMDSTKLVFLHKYKIELGEEEGELILKSKSTRIHLLSRNILLAKVIEKSLNSF